MSKQMLADLTELRGRVAELEQWREWANYRFDLLMSSDDDLAVGGTDADDEAVVDAYLAEPQKRRPPARTRKAASA
jgi:hypothetical protein